MNLEYCINFKKDIDIDRLDLDCRLVDFSAWAGSSGTCSDDSYDLVISFGNYEEVGEFLTSIINEDYAKYIDSGYVNEN